MRVFRTLIQLTALFMLTGAGTANAALPNERMVDLSSGTGSFVGDGPRLLAGDDFITFTNLGPGTYSYRFTLSGEGIDGLAASVNGQNAGTFTVGERSFAGLEGRDNGSFTVQITGRPADNAAYQGVLTVTPEPLPEPKGPALLVSGLIALAGWAWWRGRSKPKAPPGA
jgi:hypothetical protein